MKSKEKLITCNYYVKDIHFPTNLWAEYAIGTDSGKEDIFPRTRVGWRNATKVAIVDGFMHVDAAPEAISLGDYVKRNYTSDMQPDPSANKLTMEPGRCLKQRVFGVSKAHVTTARDVMPVCRKREPKSRACI